MEVIIVIITQRAPPPINNCHTPAIIDTADTHIFLPRLPEEIALLLFLIVCLLYCFFETFLEWVGEISWAMVILLCTVTPKKTLRWQISNVYNFRTLNISFTLQFLWKKNFWEASFQWFSSIKSVMDWLREVWKGQKVRVDDTSNPKTSWVASKPL